MERQMNPMGIFFGKKKGRNLNPDSGLPFGWLSQNQKLINAILQESFVFERAIENAKSPQEEYAALKSYVIYLEDGKKYYRKMGRDVGKYFDYYICGSTVAIEYTKQFRELEAKFKRK